MTEYEFAIFTNEDDHTYKDRKIVSIQGLKKEEAYGAVKQVKNCDSFGVGWEIDVAGRYMFLPQSVARNYHIAAQPVKETE
ncbi:hypothetical protein N9137_01010 [Pseudomonadales bacterium]|nr:hypothetical protein [Pseudomonadales bacterium]